MPHGPARALIVHVDRREQDAGGHLGLRPAGAVVGGYQHVATRPHHHHPRADHGAVEQQGFDRERRLYGRLGTRAPRREDGQQSDDR